MPKREEILSPDKDSPPAKVTKAASICQYCNKTFTSRGMSLHQKKCSKKLAHDKAEAKKTRAYKFCILNESVHEEILSYLSNQALTKMQIITGDRYDGCEPELAKICCKCENDNFTIGRHLCRQCFQKRPYYEYRRCVTKTMGKNLYGVKEKDLAVLPHDFCDGSYFYERIMLEEFMIKTCGSKKKWLRLLVRVRAREAAKLRRIHVHSFLFHRAPELARLVRTIHYNDLDVEDREQWYPRFEAVRAAYQGSDLSLVLDSTPCKNFIKSGIGSVDDVVNRPAAQQITGWC